MRRVLTTLTAALTLLAAPLITSGTAHAAGPFPPAWDNGAGGERMVALGDSFAAGPLVLPHRPDFPGSTLCMRSAKNYASVLAETLKVDAFTDASCSGAVSADFTAPQKTAVLSNPTQFDALGPDTTLVTFGTIGGNDIGLVQLAMDCLLSSCVPAAGTDPLADEFAALRASLTSKIDEAARRAPNAEMVLVGYGTYLPKGGCPSQILGLSGLEANYLQSQIDRLSDTLAGVAAAKGLTFADMRKVPGILDHTACAAPSQQWIRAVNTFGDGAPLHPSTLGMKAWGDHLTGIVLKVLGERDGVEVGDLTPEQVQRLAALKAKGQTAAVKVTCLGLGNLKVLTQNVTGGQGAISKVGFWIGDTKIGADQSAPYLRSDWAKDVKKHRGDLRAVVHVRDGGLRWVNTLTTKRPACLG